MTASLLDGRAAADTLLAGASRSVRLLKKKKITPKLVIVLVGKNPASVSYIRQKEKAAERSGIASELEVFDEGVSEKKLIEQMKRLNADSSVHGILVQLPLPPHISAASVIATMAPYKDVDGFHAENSGALVARSSLRGLLPCTPKGCIALLDFYSIPIAGKEVVVVGRSAIVGKPLALMLLDRDATVTVCHSQTKNLATHTRRADILVAAVGKPKLITADMVKPGAVILDVGVTKVLNKLCGDVDFDAVKEKASWISPVPGGVGPMTVACLMENVVLAAQQQFYK